MDNPRNKNFFLVLHTDGLFYVSMDGGAGLTEQLCQVSVFSK